MALNIVQVVRNPIYAGAVQVTTENLKEVAEWCQGEVRTVAQPFKGHEGNRYIKVPVDNPWSDRLTKAYTNDWILKAHKGFKVYSNKAFIATFIFVDGEKKDEAVQAEKFQSVEKIAELIDGVVFPPNSQGEPA